MNYLQNEEVEIQHAKMVALLMKPASEILGALDEFGIGLIHNALGICGEVGELAEPENDENLLEEGGDLLFYCRDMRMRTGMGPLEEFNEMDDMGPAVWEAYTRGMQFNAGEVADVVKKVTMYGQTFCGALAVRLLVALDALEYQVADILDSKGFTRADALAHNINKLLTGPNARYADGYSDQAALERADKKGDGHE